MSLNVKLWFGSANIKEIELQMPCLPQTGNNVVFPQGFVKDANGMAIPQTTFKVLAVDFIISEHITDPNRTKRASNLLMTATEITPVYSRTLECGDVEHAFTSGGIHFFRMVNPENLPQERYYKAQDYMAELSRGADREFLSAHTKAVKAAINKGDLATVAVLNNQMESRLEWITNINLLYKYATCIYFAQDEDATRYDPKRAADHIELWQKEKPDAFFLKSQLVQLLPSFEFVRQSLNRYTELQLKQDEIHSTTLLNVLLNLSQNGKENEMISTLESRIESLRTTLTHLQNSKEKA